MGKKNKTQHDIEIANNIRNSPVFKAEFDRDVNLKVKELFIQYVEEWQAIKDDFDLAQFHWAQVSQSLCVATYIAQAMLIKGDKNILLGGIDKELEKINNNWNQLVIVSKRLPEGSQEIIGNVASMIEDIVEDLIDIKAGNSTGEIIRQYIDTGDIEDFIENVTNIKENTQKRRPKPADLVTEKLRQYHKIMVSQHSDFDYWDFLIFIKDHLAEIKENKTLSKTELTIYREVVQRFADNERGEWRNRIRKVISSN